MSVCCRPTRQYGVCRDVKKMTRKPRVQGSYSALTRIVVGCKFTPTSVVGKSVHADIDRPSTIGAITTVVMTPRPLSPCLCDSWPASKTWVEQSEGVERRLVDYGHKQWRRCYPHQQSWLHVKTSNMIAGVLELVTIDSSSFLGRFFVVTAANMTNGGAPDVLPDSLPT